MPPYPSATSSASAAMPSKSAASSASSASSSTTMTPSKARQYAHLHTQLAQLNGHLADTEKLMRLTAAQAGDMRFLGGYVGGLFMGSAKVLGEEGVTPAASGEGDGEKRSKEGV